MVSLEIHVCDKKVLQYFYRRYSLFWLGPECGLCCHSNIQTSCNENKMAVINIKVFVFLTIETLRLTVTVQ